MKLVTGNSNLKLAKNIADYVGVGLSKCEVKRFADKEIFVEMHENVRGEDVFVIQSTSFPANDNLMELLIIIDTLRRASAKRIQLLFLILDMQGKIESPVQGHQ